MPSTKCADNETSFTHAKQLPSRRYSSTSPEGPEFPQKPMLKMPKTKKAMPKVDLEILVTLLVNFVFVN